MRRKFYTLSSMLASALFAVVLCAGCNVNEDYDLSALNSDEIGIGTADSSFDLPLLTVKIDPSQLIGSTSSSVAVQVLTKSDDETDTVSSESDSESDIFGALNTINSMLPSNESIDLTQVADEDGEYLDGLLDDLILELQNDEDGSKCESFLSAADDDSDLASLIEDLGVDLSDPDRATAFQDALNDDSLTDKVDSLKEKTAEMVVSAVEENTTNQISAGSIDIGSETFDLLDKNIDGESKRMYLYVLFDSDLDYNFVIDLALNHSSGAVEIPVYEREYEGEIDGTEIASGEFLSELLSELEIDFKFGITNYDSTVSSVDTTGKSINITFVARKSGGLSF